MTDNLLGLETSLVNLLSPLELIYSSLFLKSET